MPRGQGRPTPTISACRSRRTVLGVTTVRRRVNLLPWSLLISLLVVIASFTGLVDPRVYAKETTNWALQARGQDIGNLLAVIVLLVASVRQRSGSLRAGLTWLGALLYLIYAYVIYAVAVHFNGLFLVYVAVLGLSSYAVMFAVGELRDSHGDAPRPTAASRRFAAVTLLATGSLFALLWLSEVVPAVLTGTTPPSLAEAGLWVNPVHVIDLSVVLPAFILTGAAGLRGRRDGLFWTAPWLVFAVLMGASIVAGMLLLGAAGFGGLLPAAVMVTVVVAVSGLSLWRFLRGAGTTVGDRQAVQVGTR